MTKILRVLLASASLAVATPALAGPFGIDEGEKMGQLGEATHLGHQLFELKAVPNPHPDFTSYFVFATPKAGVCQIIALTEPFAKDPGGSAIMGKFDDIKEQLDSVYGKDVMVDLLEKGSLWTRPSEWLDGIWYGERSYMADWAKPTGATMKDGLVIISLEVRADSAAAARIGVKYDFDNYKSCKDELNHIAAGSL